MHLFWFIDLIKLLLLSRRGGFCCISHFWFDTTGILLYMLISFILNLDTARYRAKAAADSGVAAFSVLGRFSRAPNAQYGPIPTAGTAD